MFWRLQALVSVLFACSILYPVVSAGQDEPRDTDSSEKQTTLHTDDSYLPEFPSISRSIIGRADSSDNQELQNNIPASDDTLNPGDTKYYVFPSSALYGPKSTSVPVVPNVRKREEEDSEHQELRRRAADVTYYLTLNTCHQPTSNTSSSPPPQLQLIISYNAPHPDGTHNNPHTPDVTSGFSSFSDNHSGDIYIAVSASQAPGYSGTYSFELTVSIDDYYANYVNDSTLYFVDSDNSAAMFVSGNLTQWNPTDGKLDTQGIQEWNDTGPQFSLYIANQANKNVNGIMASSCALRNSTSPGGPFTNQTNTRVETGLTTIGGPSLQQQFYLSGLESGTNYAAAMVLPTNYSSSGPGQPGGGGTIYRQVNFTTKSVGNCKVIYNQTGTCAGIINYAVPFNSSNIPTPNLTAWYGAQADTAYQFFLNALDQVACNTSNDSQYSLAATCDDCRTTYRDWLCAVLHPRCHDMTSTRPYLHARAITLPLPSGFPTVASSSQFMNASLLNVLAFNSSRNPAIDATLQTGPYNELLPCGDVCNRLVRACPAAMGFACPYDPQSYNSSYGYPLMDGNLPQCNDPRAVFGVSLGTAIRPSHVAILGLFFLAIAIG